MFQNAPRLGELKDDRLRSLEEITESEHRFRKLVEALPDAIVVHTEGRIVFVNPFAVRLHKATRPEQLLGHEIDEFIKPELRAPIKNRIEKCYLTGEASVPMEVTLIACDGSSVDAEAVAIPISWYGAPAIEVVLRDTRERKRAEQAAHEWQKRLELAQKAGLRIGLWDWDVAANTVTWSDETYRQFGFTRDTFSGQVDDAVKRLHPDDKGRVEEAIQKVLDGKSNEYAVQYRLVRPDGTISWIDAHGVMVRNGSQHMLGVGVDITDLKNSAQSLKESEEKYLLLLNSTAEAIYGLDLKGNCTFCNPACVRLLGYQRRDDLLGKNMHALMHHTRADGTPYPEQECEIYVAIREDRPSHVSNEVLWRADGTSFAAEYWSYPMYKAGEMVGAVVTFLDISDRKRAEEELRRSEQALQESQDRYLLLLNSTAEAIYGLDLNGSCTFCNPACVRLLGHHNPEDLLGRNMHALMHHTRSDGTAYPEEECGIYVAACEGRASHVTDEVLWRADGTSFSAEYWSYPMYKAGELVGAVVTFIDISDRKRAEQALRESEEKYRELFENAIYGIFRSIPDGTLLDVNPALVSMLGYSSREELLARNLDRDIYDDSTARRSVLAQYGSSERVDGSETNWKRKDGKVITVRMSGGAVRGENGSIHHFDVIVEDITERRSLEERFRQAHKMEAVGLLAGGVAHDFNNVLNVILGNAELALQKIQPGAPQHHLEEIMKASGRAAQLTRQLLAFSRKQVLYPTVLDLNTIIDDIGKIFKRVIGEDVQIATNLERGLASIRADRGQIEQILMNLATNARDAMPHGGTLTIQTENAELGAAHKARYDYVTPGHYVRLSVSDTGVGISKEVQERVFEPFFTTKPLGRGTGLGLSTVYGIVKQSGGYVWLSSAPGAGATFDIYLPRVDEEAVPLVPASEVRSECPRGSETILVLEDEEALREVTCEVLAASGYKVLHAGRGDHAINMVEQYKGAIPLVISDVILPDMNGPSVVKKLQALHREMQVLYLSGYLDVPVAQEVIADGAVLMQKPVSLRELLRRVDETLHPRISSAPNRCRDACHQQAGLSRTTS